MQFRSRWRDDASIVLAFGGLAFGVILPFLIWGTPDGGDFFFHFTSWLEAARQWHQGVWLPRWAALANYGAGEPRFIFYPPISWNLGALLSLVFPWKAVPAVFVWLALAVAGVCSFHLAQEWLPRRESLMAALLYVANPYFFLDIYRRSAYAELLASAILPLVVLLALRMIHGEKLSAVWLGVALAGEWLTNVPVAVISVYLVAGIVVYGAVGRRSARILMWASLSYALAGGLAAFYLLPAILERKWINMDVLFWLRPEQTLFPPPDRLSVLFVIVAIQSVLVIIGAIAVLRSAQERKQWGLLAGLAAAPLVLMFRPSLFLWHHAPFLRFVQFPWRWLCVFNLAAAVLIVSAVRLAPGRARPWLWAGLVILIVASGVRLHGRPVDPRILALVIRGVDRSGGYGGMPEYAPAGTALDGTTARRSPAMLRDPSKPPRPGAPPLKNAPGGTVTVTSHAPEFMTLSVDTVRPAELLLNLVAYPAWRVVVNGQAAEVTSDNGRMLVQLPPGHSDIGVRFTRTRDRALAIWISAFAALILLAVVGLTSRTHAYLRAADGEVQVGSLAK